MNVDDLISRRTREVVRGLMSDTVLRAIDDMWLDEGFDPPTGEDPNVGGQRVSRFQAWLDTVDWTALGQARRALVVFEVALRDIFREGTPNPWLEDQRVRLQRAFKRDGLTLRDDGTFEAPAAQVIGEELLGHLDNADVIREHLDRIAAAQVRDDPAQAIGSAKELIESTARLVLSEIGQSVDDRPDLPDLVRRAQEALDIHPTSGVAGPDASGAVRKILGGAATVTTGVAELRNRGYGTGRAGGTEGRPGTAACPPRRQRLPTVVRVHPRHPDGRASPMAQ